MCITHLAVPPVGFFLFTATDVSEAPVWPNNSTGDPAIAPSTAKPHAGKGDSGSVAALAGPPESASARINPARAAPRAPQTVQDGESSRGVPGAFRFVSPRRRHSSWPAGTGIVVDARSGAQR